MDIQEIIETLEITDIKKRLSKCRSELTDTNQKLLKNEQKKREKYNLLRFRETQLKMGISNEVVVGTKNKKYPNADAREAEFIVQSAEDPDISALRDDLNQINEIIFNLKNDFEIQSKYYEELVLDYKLAIAIANRL